MSTIDYIHKAGLAKLTQLLMTWSNCNPFDENFKTIVDNSCVLHCSPPNGERDEMCEFGAMNDGILEFNPTKCHHKNNQNSNINCSNHLFIGGLTFFAEEGFAA